MIADLKYALRQFVKAPGFTATALFTLALCLGATLTIFAVIRSVLLRPLPFPEPERLVTIYNTYPKANVPRDGSSIANYYERRGGAIEAFESVGMFRADTAIVGESGATEREDIMRVSPEFFRTIGVGPAIGRSFTDEEMAHGQAHAAILTHAYWTQRYNADPAVLGQEIRVNQVPRKIVGVLPPEFRFLSSKPRVFLPLFSRDAQREVALRHSGSACDLVARLKPGRTSGEAQSQIDAQNAVLEQSNPDAKMIAEAGFRSVVAPLHADHVQAARPILGLLGAGVLCLLAIGAVNLVNLLLIRASARAKEVAIRQSMGASRWHVVRQVITETLLLTCAGAVLGLIAAAWGIPLLSLFGADQLPLGAHISLDGQLIVTALAGAVVLGALLAVPVSWLALRSDLAIALQSEGRGGTASAGAQRLRHGFIVGQIALAFVLLTGAGLLGVSLKRAMSVRPGFRPDHTLAGEIILPGQSYRSSAARVEFSERLREALMRQPGVSAVGATTTVPLSGKNIKSALTVLGRVPAPGETVRAHYSYGVAGDYFGAMGIPLREGRFLEASDSQRDVRNCVVDEDFAQRYFPQGGAIGQRVYHGGGEVKVEEAFTIVGVVGAVKHAELTDRDAPGAMYVPLLHHGDHETFFVTRTSMPAESFAPTLQKIVRGMDPDLVVQDLQPMEVRIAESLSTRRSPALLAGLFGTIALLLAAIGTYGVLSYAVAQRRREIGVRMALGAQREQIARHFLLLGTRLLAAGTVVGFLGAMLAGRAMQAILFDVPPLHLTTFAMTAVVMAAMSIGACLLPARRAARLDPIVALRAD